MNVSNHFLKNFSLSNITKTINLLKDRFAAIEDLKQLVFNSELKANEVDHIQKMIERHYWIFGEQYNLVTAAEPNFEEALRRYMHYLHKEYDDNGIEHPDKLKQMKLNVKLWLSTREPLLSLQRVSFHPFLAYYQTL